MTVKPRNNKPLTPASAAQIGFTGGVLLSFSAMFFVMLSLMISGYSLSKDDGIIERAVEGIQNNGEVAAGTLPETSSPNEQVILTADEHVRGSSDAQITWVEYSDFECPYCQQFHITMQQVVENYPDVKWVYRHFPLSFHESAQIQAAASECVAELAGNDTFWTYADLLFEQDAEMTADTLTTIAVAQGIDESAFSECLSSGRYTAKVAADLDNGLGIGIEGTPGNIIIGPDGDQQVVSGALPYDAVSLMLDNLLAE